MDPTLNNRKKAAVKAWRKPKQRGCRIPIIENTRHFLLISIASILIRTFSILEACLLNPPFLRMFHSSIPRPPHVPHQLCFHFSSDKIFLSNYFYFLFFNHFNSNISFSFLLSSLLFQPEILSTIVYFSSQAMPGGYLVHGMGVWDFHFSNSLIWFKILTTHLLGV